MTGHACLQSTSYFFPALTLLTFWVTFCVNFHLTNTALVLGILHETSSEKELLANIKRTKGSTESLFAYRIINENNRMGVEIALKSQIIDVNGFPFKAFVGDNVNQIIDTTVQFKS